MYIKRFVNGKALDESEFKKLNPRSKSAEKLLSDVLLRINDKQGRKNRHE